MEESIAFYIDFSHSINNTNQTHASKIYIPWMSLSLFFFSVGEQCCGDTVMQRAVSSEQCDPFIRAGGVARARRHHSTIRLNQSSPAPHPHLTSPQCYRFYHYPRPRTGTTFSSLVSNIHSISIRHSLHSGMSANTLRLLSYVSYFHDWPDCLGRFSLIWLELVRISRSWLFNCLS